MPLLCLFVSVVAIILDLLKCLAQTEELSGRKLSHTSLCLEQADKIQSQFHYPISIKALLQKGRWDHHLSMRTALYLDSHQTATIAGSKIWTDSGYSNYF